MNDVLKLMDKDHVELETLFDQFFSHIKNNPDQSLDDFSNFKRLIQKHFLWEEKFLFPLFEKRAGLPGRDITFVLRNEHLQIKRMFVNKIENMLSQKKYSEITFLLVGLKEMLHMHRNLETDIFYPWFDDSLDLKERERVLKLLQDKKDT